MVDVRLETDGTWPAALVRHKERWVTVHSRRDPVAEAGRWLAHARPGPLPDVLAVVGLGLGYLLDVLDARAYDGRVVALEPEPALVAGLRTRPVAQTWLAAGRLAVLPPSDWASDLWPHFTDGGDPIVLTNPVLARTHPAAVAAARAAVARAVFAARANANAKRENAARYLLNTLRNAGRIVREGDAAALLGAAPGAAALVVAAGPSLDRNLGDIAACRDRALIIAVDTAVSPLLAAGIQPDIVVAVDPTEANARHLAELPPCPDTVLVAEGSLDPEGLVAFEGRTAFFRIGNHHPWPWLREQGVDRGTLRAFGSVLTTAFDLALSMGCDPIVFAGADLAFTDDRPYARNTVGEEEWRSGQAAGAAIEDVWRQHVEAWPRIDTPGIDGRTYRTAAHLQAFRDWILMTAQTAAPRRIVNATGAGILVGDAITQQPLAAVARTLQSLPPGAREAIRRAGERSALPADRVAPALAALRAAPSSAAMPLASWAAFAGVTPDVIRQAIAPRPPAAAAPTVAARPRPRPSTAAERDDAYVDTLRSHGPTRLLTCRSVDQDLDAELRAEVAALPEGTALVVIDQVRLSCGVQVRRAIERLLCDDQDVWLESRRFVDPESDVSVLRRGALRHWPDVARADAAKWPPDHAAVADRLAPILARVLKPPSVIDIGCGAGYWVDALQRHGVTRISGVTPAPDREPMASVASSVRRAALDHVSPPPGRADVCLCLEIAQHVPVPAQEGLIAACVAASDTVVFSSALPGNPGTSPHHRPLAYWAAKFLAHGFVLDDALRPVFEERLGAAETVFENAVVFRRFADCGEAIAPALRTVLLAQAERLQDLFVQSVWWQVAYGHLAKRARRAPAVVHREALRLAAHRLLPAVDGLTRFPFRTDAARWWLAHADAHVDVYEDERLLARHASVAALARASGGGWALHADELIIAATDRSAPRANGRSYRAVVPAHVALAESQPFAEVLRRGL